MSNYDIKRGGMFSGMADAERNRYHKYQSMSDPKRIWLVSDSPNAADNIYTCDFDPKSQGFGGATLKFELVDGSEIELPGPWHSNSDALFEDTGIDVRDKHLTYIVIGKDVKFGGFEGDTILDVMYRDTDWQISDFHRGNTIAKALANLMGKPVYLYSHSHGGSSMGIVAPQKENDLE